MYRILVLINVLCMGLIIYIKKKKNFKTTIGKNILLGFGIFCTVGSVALISIKEGCITYCILSFIIYSIYIFKTKIFSKFSLNELKTDASSIAEKQKEKINENIEKIKTESYEEKIKSSNINKAKISNPDYFLKLKELRDNDVITQEEFDKMKNDLINKDINDSKPKKSKTKASTIVLAIFTILLIYMLSNWITNTDITTNQDKSKNILASYNIPQEKIDNIYSILNQCGYNTYYPNFTIEKSGDNEEIPNSIGFTIKNGEQIIGFIDIKDNEIDNLQYSDKLLYEKGAIQHTLSEYLITSDEKSKYISQTKEIIKNVLKSPSTAKFPWDYNEWAIGKKDGSIILQSYVDAQNSFGATTRSSFQVTYTDGTVTSLIFDGVEYIK